MKDPMTIEELEKCGVIHMPSRISPHNFFVPQVGEVRLHEPYTMYEIYEIIYGHALSIGLKQGAIKKADEVKKILFIDSE